MQIGFVGLGKMGGNMALRLVQGAPDGSAPGGHQVVGFAKDPNPDLAAVPGISIVNSLEAMVAKLKPPRAVWVMVPAGDATESVISSLAKLLHPDDLIIDGGNSYYKDSVRREQGLANRRLGFLDVGTSGGVWGRQEGYCMMVGGQQPFVHRCVPIFDTLAPAEGWVHTGPPGSGHFTKMVHNGIEYGLMAAYAEGFEVLHKAPFPLNLADIATVWNRGSVIRSWLLELSERVFKQEGDLSHIAPYVVDSGEGQWTVQAAMEEAVPAPVISAALRNQFGGHEIKRTGEKRIAPTGEVTG